MIQAAIITTEKKNSAIYMRELGDIHNVVALTTFLKFLAEQNGDWRTLTTFTDDVRFAKLISIIVNDMALNGKCEHNLKPDVYIDKYDFLKNNYTDIITYVVDNQFKIISVDPDEDKAMTGNEWYNFIDMTLVCQLLYCINKAQPRKRRIKKLKEKMPSICDELCTTYPLTEKEVDYCGSRIPYPDEIYKIITDKELTSGGLDVLIENEVDDVGDLLQMLNNDVKARIIADMYTGRTFKSIMHDLDK